MALVSESIQPSSSRKRFTLADLEVLPESLPSGPVRYELVRGELRTTTLPGYEHSRIQGELACQLTLQGKHRGLGKARASVGIVLSRNPDTVVCADAAFIANASLPIQCGPEGYLETMPDLVVEIRSKNDSLPEVLDKVGDYLQAGVRVVWVVDPATQTVTAHRKRRKPKVFTATDTLTVEDVIPGFQFPVADVFRE